MWGRAQHLHLLLGPGTELPPEVLPLLKLMYVTGVTTAAGFALANKDKQPLEFLLERLKQEADAAAKSCFQ